MTAWNLFKNKSDVYIAQVHSKCQAEGSSKTRACWKRCSLTLKNTAMFSLKSNTIMTQCPLSAWNNRTRKSLILSQFLGVVQKRCLFIQFDGWPRLSNNVSSEKWYLSVITVRYHFHHHPWPSRTSSFRLSLFQHRKCFSMSDRKRALRLCNPGPVLPSCPLRICGI